MHKRCTDSTSSDYKKDVILWNRKTESKLCVGQLLLRSVLRTLVLGDLLATRLQDRQKLAVSRSMYCGLAADSLFPKSLFWTIWMRITCDWREEMASIVKKKRKNGISYYISYRITDSAGKRKQHWYPCKNRKEATLLLDEVERAEEANVVYIREADVPASIVNCYKTKITIEEMVSSLNLDANICEMLALISVALRRPIRERPRRLPQQGQTYCL